MNKTIYIYIYDINSISIITVMVSKEHLALHPPLAICLSNKSSFLVFLFLCFLFVWNYSWWNCSSLIIWYNIIEDDMIWYDILWLYVHYITYNIIESPYGGWPVRSAASRWPWRTAAVAAPSTTTRRPGAIIGRQISCLWLLLLLLLLILVVLILVVLLLVLLSLCCGV